MKIRSILSLAAVVLANALSSCTAVPDYQGGGYQGAQGPMGPPPGYCPPPGGQAGYGAPVRPGYPPQGGYSHQGQGGQGGQGGQVAQGHGQLTATRGADIHWNARIRDNQIHWMRNNIPVSGNIVPAEARQGFLNELRAKGFPVQLLSDAPVATTSSAAVVVPPVGPVLTPVAATPQAVATTATGAPAPAGFVVQPGTVFSDQPSPIQ